MLTTILVGIATWILFLLGEAIYIAKRATLTAASPKNSSVWTVADYLRLHATMLTFEVGLGAAVLLVWSESPDRFHLLLAWLWPRFAGMPILPVTPGTAFLFGLLWQVMADWLEEKYWRSKKPADPGKPPDPGAVKDGNL